MSKEEIENDSEYGGISSDYFQMPERQKDIEIRAQPVDTSARINNNIKLSAIVRSPDPTFQWYNGNGEKIPNKTSNELYFGSIKMSDFGFYRLQIIDRSINRMILTRWVELKNSTPLPHLISPPRGGNFRKGNTISLIAHFENASLYQWYKDGDKLKGCAGNTLTIRECLSHNTGEYTVIATNESNIFVRACTKVNITNN